MARDSRCSRCCSKFCRGMGKFCKKLGKFTLIILRSVASGFYGCTRRKAIINHVPAILFFHIFPLVFSILSVVSVYMDYSFLFSSGDSIPADILSSWNTFRRWSMSVSAFLMVVFAFNLSIHLHIVRDEFKKICLSLHVISIYQSHLSPFCVLFFPMQSISYLRSVRWLSLVVRLLQSFMAVCI